MNDGVSVRDEAGRFVYANQRFCEMFGYTTHLRSLSQGRASAAMEPLHYAAAPPSTLERMLHS